MAELNLTTEDVITSVVEHELDLLYEAAQGRELPYGPEGIRDAFRRWLAAHDRAVKAEALREAAEFVDEFSDEGVIWRGDRDDDDSWYEQPIDDWLRARADEIEGATND